MAQFHPAATTAVRGPGRHAIRFSNCDKQMLLWVDDRLVSFDAPTYYDEHLDNNRPDEGDKRPVGVASLGVPVEIGALRVLRDIYYIALEGESSNISNHDVVYLIDRDGDISVREPMEEPGYVDFPLEADQFFALGDNSARARTAGCGERTTISSPANC